MHRYEIFRGPVIPKSSTSLVVNAFDHAENVAERPMHVVLKLMCNQDQWLREIHSRAHLDSKFVVKILRSHSSDIETGYSEQAFRFELTDYPYLIV